MDDPQMLIQKQSLEQCLSQMQQNKKFKDICLTLDYLFGLYILANELDNGLSNPFSKKLNDLDLEGLVGGNLKTIRKRRVVSGGPSSAQTRAQQLLELSKTDPVEFDKQCKDNFANESQEIRNKKSAGLSALGNCFMGALCCVGGVFAAPTVIGGAAMTTLAGSYMAKGCVDIYKFRGAGKEIEKRLTEINILLIELPKLHPPPTDLNEQIQALKLERDILIDKSGGKKKRSVKPKPKTKK